MAEPAKSSQRPSGWRVLFANLVAMVGICAFGYGLWIISHPLAFCVIGPLLFIAAVLMRIR